MRIVATPDGTVNRIDRALWMTRPFDRAWATPSALPYRVAAAAAANGHTVSTYRPAMVAATRAQ